MGTDEFPAFYCRRSGHKLDYAAKDEAEIAAILKAKWALGMEGGVLIANPIAEADGLDFNYMEGIINVALEAADAAGVHGKDITPFLLAKVKELTGGESFKSQRCPRAQQRARRREDRCRIRQEVSRKANKNAPTWAAFLWIWEFGRGKSILFSRTVDGGCCLFRLKSNIHIDISKERHYNIRY